MRGDDPQHAAMFSDLSPEARVPAAHPLRRIRIMVDVVLKELSPQFDRLYAHTGRPSIAPEQVLRALLLQVLYTVRSERLLMEQLDYNLLFRWFVGLNMDDPVWDADVQQEPRASACRGCGPRSGPCTAGGRALHRRWDPDRSLGRAAELQAESDRHAAAPAG